MITSTRRAVLPFMLTLLVVLASCCGCGRQIDEVNVAIVVGAHQGAPGFLQGLVSDNKFIGALASELTPIAESKGSVTIIREDGLPAAVDTVTLADPGSWPTGQQLNDAETANTQHMNKAIQAAAAQHAQADPISALNLAANAVRGKKNPKVLMLSDGLQTTGSVLMQTGILNDADGTKLARQLKGKAIGSMAGITVTWIGLCSTSGKQLPCPALAQQTLEDFYNGLVHDAGGTTITFDTTPLPPGTASGQPDVDVVPWESAALSGKGSSAKPRRQTLTQVLDQDSLRFVENTPRYADPPAAKSTLTGLANTLTRQKYPTVWVYGCTNDDGSSTRALVALSQRRADHATQDLRRYGATSKLIPTGLGRACPGYVPGGGTKNMRVIISSTNLR